MGKTITVHVVKKYHDTNGNPMYLLFIPTITGKHKGLRKRKVAHMYSTQSYNLDSKLKNYVFKGHTVKIKR